jgi:hypothetical protein
VIWNYGLGYISAFKGGWNLAKDEAYKKGKVKVERWKQEIASEDESALKRLQLQSGYEQLDEDLEERLLSRAGVPRGLLESATGLQARNRYLNQFGYYEKATWDKNAKKWKYSAPLKIKNQKKELLFEDFEAGVYGKDGKPATDKDGNPLYMKGVVKTNYAGNRGWPDVQFPSPFNQPGKVGTPRGKYKKHKEPSFTVNLVMQSQEQSTDQNYIKL